jgi:hypothetical protein
MHARSTPLDFDALLREAKRDLDARTDTIEIIADWRDDLLIRIARAQIRFELIGLDDIEQDQLVAEVEEFKRACRCIAWCAKQEAAA